MTEGHDVFISYASEDRSSFVRPLAEALRRMGALVWYDEFMLKPGDSISAKIDGGLRDSRYAVLVLSHSFFKRGWTESEYRALFQRGRAEGRNLIIPIYFDVTSDDVRAYSPLLADIWAIRDVLEVDWVAQRIVDTIRLGTHVGETVSAAVKVGEKSLAARRSPHLVQPLVHFGYTLDPKFVPYFGCDAAPRDVPEKMRSFDGRDNKYLRSVVSKIPDGPALNLIELSSDVGFAEAPDGSREAFFQSRSAIHVSSDGAISLRFPQRGAHILYDIYTTIGSAYAIARGLVEKYDVSPEYHFRFGYRLDETTYPKGFVDYPHLEGMQFDANVLNDFGDSIAEVIVKLARGGSVVKDLVTDEVARDGNDFWRQHFPGC